MKNFVLEQGLSLRAKPQEKKGGFIMKKIICVSVLFMICFAIVSCSGGEELQSFISEGATDELDFNGRTFTIHGNWYESWDPTIYEDKGTALSVENDALISHNALVSEKYNCKIVSTEADFNFASSLGVDIAANTVDYDLIDTNAKFLAGIAMAGYLCSWDDTSLDITNYEKYGTEQYQKGATFDGKRYGIWPYYWLAQLDFRGMVVVNNNLYKKYSDVSVHEMYENGTWTFDGFKNVLNLFTNTGDGNEIYPLAYYDSQMLAMCSVLANGGSLVTYDNQTGLYSFGLYDSKAMTGLSFAQSLCSEKLAKEDGWEMNIFDTDLSAVIGLCENWNLNQILQTIDDADVITFPFGPDAEYGKTCSAYRTNNLRYVAMPQTGEDGSDVATFVSLWFSELEEDTKATIISNYNSSHFFNEESKASNKFMAENAVYDYGSHINNIYEDFVSQLGGTISGGASITQFLDSQKDSVQQEINENLNN